MTVTATFQIEHPEFVLEHFNRIRLFQSDTREGDYEYTGQELSIDANTFEYSFAVALPSAECDVPWFRAQLYNTITEDESALGNPVPGKIDADKVGWSFGNYAVPAGEWGEVLTPDDMRYTYMFGIDAQAEDRQRSEFSDEQFRFFVDQAVAEFEAFLKCDIRKRIRLTNPSEELKRGRRVGPGVDYTDEEDTYPFDPQLWGQYGFLQLRRTPVIKVRRMTMYSPVRGEVLDVVSRNWIRLEKNHGQVNVYPTRGSAEFGPFSVFGLPWSTMYGGRFPQGWEVDYETGWPDAGAIPDDLRGVIGQWATVKCLDAIGDGLLAGFSSQSVSLDGLSESFSSTQSATSAYFGARIKSYIDQVSMWLERNRYAYTPPAMGFIGV